MSASVGAIAGLADLLVDAHTGIVTAVEEVPREPGSPDFFHYAATASDTRAFTRNANFRNTGGASTDRQRAMAKAIGEAVERYCAAIFDVEELPLAAADEAPFDVVSPQSFALYTAEQYQGEGFPWIPFTESTPVRWVRGIDLASGHRIGVPAAMTYVPYTYYRGTGDAPIVQPISTGLACHSTPARAALSGLYEVVERDAFTIMWHAGLAMPQILIETLSDEAYEMVERLERPGNRVTLFDLTLDHGITTVLSVLRSDAPEAPALVFAAASSLDPDQAACSALEELAHTRRYSQQIRTRLSPLVLDAGLRNVADQIDHLNVYVDPRNAHFADFAFRSKKRVEFGTMVNRATGDPRGDLAEAVRLLGETGHRTIVVDITSSDVADAGLTVVRVVVPGFQPLFMEHRLRALAGPRLWDVPKKLGLQAIDPPRGNPYPHPYP